MILKHSSFIFNSFFAFVFKFHSGYRAGWNTDLVAASHADWSGLKKVTAVKKFPMECQYVNTSKWQGPSLFWVPIIGTTSLCYLCLVFKSFIPTLHSHVFLNSFGYQISFCLHMTFTPLPKPPQGKTLPKLTLDIISGFLRSQKFIKSSYKRSKSSLANETENIIQSLLYLSWLSIFQKSPILLKH